MIRRVVVSKVDTLSVPPTNPLRADTPLRHPAPTPRSDTRKEDSMQQWHVVLQYVFENSLNDVELVRASSVCIEWRDFFHSVTTDKWEWREFITGDCEVRSSKRGIVMLPLRSFLI